jgi:ankyrin repeat protein
VSNTFWQACHGGQRRAAERLVAAGANINASPAANNQTALDQAAEPAVAVEAEPEAEAA